MKHFAVGATTAAAAVSAGVVFLVFRFEDRSVNRDIVDLYIAITGIVGECYAQFAFGVSCCGVVVHTGRNRPGLDNIAADHQINALVTGHTAHADNNGVRARHAG